MPCDDMYFVSPPVETTEGDLHFCPGCWQQLSGSR